MFLVNYSLQCKCHSKTKTDCSPSFSMWPIHFSKNPVKLIRIKENSLFPGVYFNFNKMNSCLWLKKHKWHSIMKQTIFPQFTSDKFVSAIVITIFKKQKKPFAAGTQHLEAPHQWALILKNICYIVRYNFKNKFVCRQIKQKRNFQKLALVTVHGLYKKERNTRKMVSGCCAPSSSQKVALPQYWRTNWPFQMVGTTPAALILKNICNMVR